MFSYVVTFYTKKMNRVKSWRVSGVATLEKKRKMRWHSDTSVLSLSVTLYQNVCEDRWDLYLRSKRNKQ